MTSANEKRQLDAARLRWSRALARETWCRRELKNISLDDAWSRLTATSRQLLARSDSLPRLSEPVFSAPPWRGTRAGSGKVRTLGREPKTPLRSSQYCSDWGLTDFLGSSGLVVASGNADQSPSNKEGKWVTLKVTGQPRQKCQTSEQSETGQSHYTLGLEDETRSAFEDNDDGVLGSPHEDDDETAIVAAALWPPRRLDSNDTASVSCPQGVHVPAEDEDIMAVERREKRLSEDNDEGTTVEDPEERSSSDDDDDTPVEHETFSTIKHGQSEEVATTWNDWAIRGYENPHNFESSMLVECLPSQFEAVEDNAEATTAAEFLTECFDAFDNADVSPSTLGASSKLGALSKEAVVEMRQDTWTATPALEVRDAGTETRRVKRGRGSRTRRAAIGIRQPAVPERRLHNSYWLPGGVGGTISVGTSSRPTHAAWASPARARTSPQKVGAKKLGLGSPRMRSPPRSTKPPRRSRTIAATRRDARVVDEYVHYFGRRRTGEPLPSSWTIAASGRSLAFWRALRAQGVAAVEISLASDRATSRAVTSAASHALDALNDDSLVALSVVTNDSTAHLDSSSDEDDGTMEILDPALCLRAVSRGLKSFDWCVSLRHLALVGLDVAGRSGKFIDAALAPLNALTSLDLSNNGLHHAPGHLPRTINRLSLKTNYLKSTAFLEHLNRLHTLDLANNLLRSVTALHPLVLARASLRELRVHANPLCHTEPAWRLSLRDLFPRAVLH